MTIENIPAKKARNVNTPHRLEGKDLEMFMGVFNYVKETQGEDGCMLWPETMPEELRPSVGYRVRVNAGYGIFHIGLDRPLSAHKAVYVNCHPLNPNHDEVPVDEGGVDQIRHRFCETPNSEVQLPNGTMYAKWGGNPRCVNPNHLIPGPQSANRLDKAEAMINQPAVDTLKDRIAPPLFDLIKNESADPRTIVDLLKLKPKDLGLSMDELLRDIMIIQIETKGMIAYPRGETHINLKGFVELNKDKL
jgi:hypothetical protein